MNMMNMHLDDEHDMVDEHDECYDTILEWLNMFDLVPW